MLEEPKTITFHLCDNCLGKVDRKLEELRAAFFIETIKNKEQENAQLKQHIECLLRGIREWDLADAPSEDVQEFLEAAARGEYLSP